MELNYTVYTDTQNKEAQVPKSFTLHDQNILECQSDAEAYDVAVNVMNDHYINNVYFDFDSEGLAKEIRRMRELHGMPQ